MRLERNENSSHQSNYVVVSKEGTGLTNFAVIWLSTPALYLKSRGFESRAGDQLP